MTNASSTELIVFTTNKPTTTRLYTLAHNPAYRNGMTLKGYMQSHAVDYYLGFGMKLPSAPAITYVGR
jgi:rhamnogalacturonan endolyase